MMCISLSWGFRTSVLCVGYKGNNAEYITSIWSRGGPAINNDLFININKYLKQLSASDNDAIWGIYQEVDGLFTNEVTVDPLLDAKIRTYVQQVFTIIDYHRLHQWCVDCTSVKFDSGLKTELTDKDRVELTYFTLDYINLIVLSELLKPIMPIWAMYEQNMKSLVGNKLIFSNLTSMLSSDFFNNVSAIIKLHEYVNVQITGRNKNLRSVSLVGSIGYGEIDTHLLATLLVKKVTPFNSSLLEGNLVKNIHNHLKQALDTLCKVNLRDKMGTVTDMEDKTITDMCKVISHIPPSTINELEVAIDAIDKIATDIEPTISIEAIRFAIEEIDVTATFHPWKITVMAAVSCEVLNIKSLSAIGRETLTINLLCICKCVLENWGLNAVAHVLYEPAVDKPIHHVGDGIKGFKPMSSDTVVSLREIYPFDKETGVVWVNNTVSIIERSIWDIPNSYYDDLSNQLAQLIIRIAGE